MNNKVVFITGASAGIGEACAKAYAKAGAKLILTARRQERLDDLAAALSHEYDVEILPIMLDVSDRAQVESVFSSLKAGWQDIDVLINNAGLSTATGPFSALDLDQLEQMIDVNLKGVLYVTHTALPQMIKRNIGHIVNIGSISSHEAYPGANIYTATKHGLLAMTKVLRLDLLGTNIRVSQVDPGPVHTEFSEKRWGKERSDKFYNNFRALYAEDIADAVVFCTSRKSHINVEDIIINSIDFAGGTMAGKQESIFDK